ncbi:MAG: hypothetical protein HY303_21785 [Candidatus Wallbacteria bacterium]|nr:hypothetical protein [Candidatus Wallbacteria bacterium]
MNDRLRPVLLVSILAGSCLGLMGCGEQPAPTPLPPQIVIDLRVPPPVIVNREVIVRVPAEQLTGQPAKASPAAPSPTTLARVPDAPSGISPAAPNVTDAIVPAATKMPDATKVL